MDDLRRRCAGITPLTGRLATWQSELLGHPTALADLVEAHGSPVNLIDPAPLPAHAAELIDAAAARGVELRVFFARKANKALTLVDTALGSGHGVDVASHHELQQVLSREPDAQERVIVSAAVKTRTLLELAVRAGVTVSVDNEDELELVTDVARHADRAALIAPRLAWDRPVPTRFGLSLERWRSVLGAPVDGRHLSVRGVHLHLHGYAARDRADALVPALELLELMRDQGHPADWIDIGGGIPMNYLDDQNEWENFWTAHRSALLAGRPLTWEGHGLGLQVVDGRILGEPAVYPAAQTMVGAPWLLGLLDTQLPGGSTVAEVLTAASVRLHCEPGRALLDGCGMTVARVQSRKQRTDGTWLIALAMNRTQCRSAADDFLVDPVLVPAGDPARSTGPIEGYLVGAYCIEAELLTWRRLRFPHGVCVGDLIVFVNTAGYQMHILESASHQIPLAVNLTCDEDRNWVEDPIQTWRPPDA